MTRSVALWTLPALALVAGSLAGCVVGPTYAPPATDTPPAFSTGAQAEPPVGAWWKGFSDPELDRLVDQALTANPDVRTAAARLAQARAQLRVTKAGDLPTVSASAQASYTRLSKNAFPPGLQGLLGGGGGKGGGSAVIGLPGTQFPSYQAGFDASWQLDIFGGQRRADEAATARAEAAVWTARDTQVTVAAEVANAYLQERALARRVAVADEALASGRDLLSFVRVRARQGLATSIEVRTQERQVDQLSAQREDLIAQRDAQAHAVAALIGRAPLSLNDELAGAPASAPQMVDIPTGLPSQLLERRPDIRAAERKLAASTADVGQATADLYPKISLTGSAQLVSTDLSKLLSPDSLLAEGAAGLTAPVFDGGRLRATVKLRKAQARESLVAYDGAVLTALKEVEDALARLSADRERLDAMGGASRAAHDAADTANVRYRHGLTAYTDVLTARETWFTAEDALDQAQAAAIADEVALYKALGGGWDVNDINGAGK